MVHFFRALLAVFFLSLAACGGGGSSGGSTPVPPPGGGSGGGNTSTLTLSQSTVSFSGTQYEAVPDPIAVRANISGTNTAGIVFGTLPGVDSLPSWLNVEVGELVNNSVDATFSILTTSLPPGTYRFTVRAVTVDANQNVLDTEDIAVSFVLAEGIPLTINPTSIDVVMHPSSDSIVQVISLDAGDYVWSAFSAEANVTPDNGRGPQDVTLEIFYPVGLSPADSPFTGVVDFLASGTDLNAMFEINYTLVNTLASVEDEFSFSTVSGASRPSDQGLNLIGEGLNWTATSDVDWVVFSATSGTIATDDNIVDMPEGNDLFITVDTSDLAPGLYDGVISIAAEAEQVLEIPISLAIGPEVIIVADTGIGFTELPGVSNLTAQVAVEHVVRQVVPWSAVSDVSWLSVTASGMTGESIQITADPTSLADGFHEGVISVSSSDPDIDNTEQITVGLFKSSNGAVTRSIDLDMDNFGTDVRIIADPVRPYVYVSTLGETLIRYNIFSGDVVGASIDPEPLARGITISDDGAHMFVSVGGDTPMTEQIDLSTDAIVQTWPVGADDIDFARLRGVPHLVMSSGQVLSIANGEIVGSFEMALNIVDASKNGETICTANREVGPLTAQCYDIIDYSGFPTAPVPVSEGRDNEFSSLGGFTANIVVSNDGLTMYVASNDPQFYSVSTADMMINGAAFEADNFPSSITIGSDGRIYGAYDDFQNSGEFVRVYDALGTTLGTTTFPTELLEGRTLVVSADSSQIAGLSKEFSANDTIRLELAPAP